MTKNQGNIAFKTFMGHSPAWYKQAVIFCLIFNPVLLLIASKSVTGWVILIEFIATLALALKAYPLIPGGLIALEMTFMGLVSPEGIFHEVEANLGVILLLLFMVSGIHFMKEMLSWLFTKIIVGIQSKTLLSLTFCFAGAFLSAWLDALTVTAVMITVVIGFYNVYTSVSLDERIPEEQDQEKQRLLANKDLADFNGFLRNLMMHGLVGTALGGMATQVGEPQNLIIASKMNWDFMEFYYQMAHVSLPILFFGMFTTFLLEKSKIVGYGYQLPLSARAILLKNAQQMKNEMDAKKRWNLWMQGIAAIWLIVALAFHLAEVGLIGLSVVVFLASVMGKVDENTIGHAFEEATPFTSLLVVFFVIVAMIEETHLFDPVIQAALQTEGAVQPYVFFVFSGLLSAISDNVFVGTIYIKEAVAALGTESQQAIDIAVAINVGTNIPSIATPNGQAAFLFLLTNALAAHIKLSYLRMVLMALPYFVVLSAVSMFFLLWHWI